MWVTPPPAAGPSNQSPQPQCSSAGDSAPTIGCRFSLIGSTAPYGGAERSAWHALSRAIIGAGQSKPLPVTGSTRLIVPSPTALTPARWLAALSTLLLIDSGECVAVPETILQALRTGEDLLRSTRYGSYRLPSLPNEAFATMRDEPTCTAADPCYLMCASEVTLVAVSRPTMVHGPGCNDFFHSQTFPLLSGLLKDGDRHLLSGGFLRALHLLAPRGYFIASRDDTTHRLSACDRRADNGRKAKHRRTYAEYSLHGGYDSKGSVCPSATPTLLCLLVVSLPGCHARTRPVRPT